MTKHDQQRDHHAADKKWKLITEDRPTLGDSQQYIQQRKRARRDDRSQADVSPDVEDDDEDADRDRAGKGVVRKQPEHHPGAAGDAFAALEFQKYAEHVPEDGRESHAEPQ